VAHQGLLCCPWAPEFVMHFANIKAADILPEFVKHTFQTLPVFHWCKHLMEGWATGTDNDVYELLIAPLKCKFNFNKKAFEAIVQATARAVAAASTAAPIAPCLTSIGQSFSFHG